jgi:aquaporin Z
LIHLIGIPVTNLSVNPARRTGPAMVVGGWAVSQLGLFRLSPIVGAAVAGFVYPLIAGTPEARDTKVDAAALPELQDGSRVSHVT